MKKILIVTLLAASFSSAAYATTPTGTNGPTTAVSANSGPNTQDTKVNTTSNATANNGGQSLTYAPVYNTPANTTNTQTIKYDGPQTVNQNVTGSNTQTIKYDGPQTVNQNTNVSGSTSNNQTIKYDGPQTVNQNVNGKTEQTINGTQTQNIVSSGGTNSTVHQTFGSQTIKNTPSVSGPPLTSSNDTCMGSASGSVNAPGFGLSLGKTYTDDNCVMLKNSRELWNMGMKAASMALMCMDKNNRAALEMTGFVCPQSEPRRVQTSATVVTTERDAALARGEPVDPIVRERVGLPKIRE